MLRLRSANKSNQELNQNQNHKKNIYKTNQLVLRHQQFRMQRIIYNNFIANVWFSITTNRKSKQKP